MKKLLSLALLLSFAAVALLGVSCTSEEAIWAGAGVFIFICWAFFALIGIFLLVVWIITIVDCAKRENDKFPGGGENSKTIWLVILIATWVVGFWWVAAIVYYFMVMKKMPRKK